MTSIQLPRPDLVMNPNSVDCTEIVRGYQAPREMFATSYKSTLDMSSTFAP